VNSSSNSGDGPETLGRFMLQSSLLLKRTSALALLYWHLAAEGNSKWTVQNLVNLSLSSEAKGKFRIFITVCWFFLFRDHGKMV